MGAGNAEWTAAAASRTVEAFAADFPHLFLIGAAPDDGDSGRNARTLQLSASELKRALNEAREASLVLPLKKRLETFPSMISVGRTANNDIVIESPQISKFHASFRVRGDALELEDAGSANGTYLKGRPLQKGAPQAVRAGDHISFGSVAVQLYSPEDAWRWLRMTTLG